MNVCAQDLDEFGASAVHDFQSRVEAIPEDMCAPFHQAAGTLETEILSFYKVAVRCAQRTEDLAHVASIWETMARICADAAKELEGLHAKHPYCGARAFHDKLLDLKNKCQRLQEMHL